MKAGQKILSVCILWTAYSLRPLHHDDNVHPAGSFIDEDVTPAVIYGFSFELRLYNTRAVRVSLFVTKTVLLTSATEKLKRARKEEYNGETLTSGALFTMESTSTLYTEQVTCMSSYGNTSETDIPATDRRLLSWKYSTVAKLEIPKSFAVRGFHSGFQFDSDLPIAAKMFTSLSNCTRGLCVAHRLTFIHMQLNLEAPFS